MLNKSTPNSIHKSRSGILRSFAAQTPTSPLARSSSTPQRLFEESRSQSGSSRLSLASGSSPFASGSLSNSPASYYYETTSFRVTPVRRKNTSLGSPGVRALSKAVGANDGVAMARRASPSSSKAEDGARSSLQMRVGGRKSAAFIRRKPLRQRMLDVPLDMYDRFVSLSKTIQEALMDSALGYPLALALHAASLLTHLLSPASDFSLSLLTGLDASPSDSAAGDSVFAGGSTRRRGGVRRYIETNKANTWSWTATLMSLALVALSVGNAYRLSTARKRYRLWMRNVDSHIASSNARLVPIEMDGEGEDASLPTFQERLTELTLRVLGDMPFISRLLPEIPPRLRTSSTSLKDARIYELSIWEPNEVSLRLASAYSPLHSLLWHVAGTPLLPVRTLLGWFTFFATQVALSAQLVFLVTMFGGLVKDRALLAAEVMHEYNEKFVLPRAMPVVRDASVMTSEAEMIKPSDWRQ